jgi:hypothetical protein
VGEGADGWPLTASNPVAVPAPTALNVAGGTLVACWRYGRSLRRASVRTRAHAEAARITGQRIGAGNPAFVLDATQPAVYCVPGRPATIVLTTGALAVLGPDQLTAVLAHERAHLAGRHHLLLAVTRSLAAVAPAVPLFARGTSAVARLAEMRADDVAARRAGGSPTRRLRPAGCATGWRWPRSPWRSPPPPRSCRYSRLPGSEARSHVRGCRHSAGAEYVALVTRRRARRMTSRTP